MFRRIPAFDGEAAAERLNAFRNALDDLESLEFGAPRAMLAGQYGLALGRSGQRDQGIATVVRALAQCDETGDHWYAGELRRIHGELLLMAEGGAPPSVAVVRDAEVCFVAALEDSLMRGCRSLQLRAAISLGSLWHAQGRSAEAVGLIRSATTAVAEGLDWDDFDAATRLLQIATRASAHPYAASGIRPAGQPAAANTSEAPPQKVAQRG